MLRALETVVGASHVVTDPDVVARRAVDAVSSGAYDCIRLPWHSAAERTCAQAVHAALVEAGVRVPRGLGGYGTDRMS